MHSERLTKHFTLAELTKTNSPLSNIVDSPIVLDNLRTVCEHILEPVRAHFKNKIIVHSGYRSIAVNTAVHGSKHSQHCKGEAVDFHVVGYSVYDVALWISKHLAFDQVILENFIPNVATSGWVHCSYKRHHLRRIRLTKFVRDENYYPGIILAAPK